MRRIILSALAAAALCVTVASAAEGQWPVERAQAWGRTHGWPVGSNFVPSNASNQLEMWQAESFDPQRIDQEFGWAESLGMNTMRVFLHDLLWQQDSKAFTARIDQFLSIAARHHIRPVFVLFDSCWDPNPKLGKQQEPRPGIHNSRWVQSPGVQAVANPAEHARLEAYVKGVVGAFAKDDRILAWDVWNEPANGNDSSYTNAGAKPGAVAELLARTFAWAHSVHPMQPLTSGIWDGDWSDDAKLTSVQRVQLDNSDIVSFHSYSPAAEFQKRVGWLSRYHRPILCTEYMARPQGSTFATILPLAKRLGVGAINWGFVAGRSQTYLPWDSWQKPYIDHQPPVWFHDIFHADGKPYREEEVTLIRQMTGKAQ
jgi:hypothetical protein